MLKGIFSSFISLFVAVDAVGVLPIFVSLTKDLTDKDRSRVILQSILTGGCLAICFIFVGKAVFNVLGVTVGDFMVAGGAILFSLAIIDLVTATKKRRIPSLECGVVPLGTPLIVGPAVLTTCMLMITEYGIWPTVISAAGNILLAGLILRFSFVLVKFLGDPGTRALSKITSLLLAAIGVMLMRKGLSQLMATI